MYAQRRKYAQRRIWKVGIVQRGVCDAMTALFDVCFKIGRQDRRDRIGRVNCSFLFLLGEYDQREYASARNLLCSVQICAPALFEYEERAK